MSDERNPHPDDAALSALIDGELPPEEAARLRARIAGDAALSARYESLCRADDEVRRTFASADMGPMPERVLQLLRDDEAADRPEPTGAAKVVPLWGWRRLYSPPTALAAGVALFFIGFALARVLLPQAGTAPGTAFTDAAGVVAETSPLYRVLEEVPSSETASLAEGMSATPRLTFARAGGGYCRLVTVAGESGASDALACRENGAWRMQVAAFADRETVPGDGYRPAAGGRSPVVDRAIDSLIEGSPLGAEAEARLLRGGWPDAGDHSP